MLLSVSLLWQLGIIAYTFRVDHLADSVDGGCAYLSVNRLKRFCELCFHLYAPMPFLRMNSSCSRSSRSSFPSGRVATK